MADNLPSLQVLAKSRENTVFSGLARSVSSFNQNGLFDILPNHANFISIINGSISIVKADGKLQKIDLPTNALIRVYRNMVSIYLGLSEKAES